LRVQVCPGIKARPYLKNNQSKKGLGHASSGPEFKPQNCQKKKVSVDKLTISIREDLGGFLRMNLFEKFFKVKSDLDSHS
jgi:hypothetical protein